MKTHTLLSTAAVALVISSGAFAQSQRGEQRSPGSVERIQDNNSRKGNQAQNQAQPGGNRELNGRNVRTVYPNSNQNAQSSASQNVGSATAEGAGSAQSPNAAQPSQRNAQQNAQPRNTQAERNAQQNAQQPSTAQQSRQPASTAQRPSSQPSGTAQSNTARPAASTAAQQPGQNQTNQRAATTQQNSAASASGTVALNTQQRTRVAQTIARHNVRPLTNVNFSISVGTRVPRSVRLHALTSDLVTFVPQFRGYSYFVAEDQIVIVEPSSYDIVAVVPYGESTTVAHRGALTSRSVSLNTRERSAIRKHVKHGRASARAITRERYVVGERVPSSVTIESFPETVYTEVPVVRRYRYFQDAEDVILVDPAEDRIVEIIR